MTLAQQFIEWAETTDFLASLIVVTSLLSLFVLGTTRLKEGRLSRALTGSAVLALVIAGITTFVIFLVRLLNAFGEGGSV